MLNNKRSSKFVLNFELFLSALQNFTAKINKNIKQLNNLSNEQSNTETMLKRLSIITETIAQLNFISETLDDELNSILNSILFSKQNVLSPHILNPKDLIQQLTLIQSHLPSDHTFPVPLTTGNGHLILDISTLDVFYQQPYLVFVIHVPLIEIFKYNFFSINAFPIPVQNQTSNYLLIQPDYKYLLMSNDKRRYVVLKDKNTCKSIMNDHYICQSQQFQQQATMEPCEVLLFRQPVRTLSSTCHYVGITGSLLLWDVISTNTWMLTATYDETIDIACNDQPPQHQPFKNTVIIQLDPGCTAFVNSLRLQAPVQQLSNTTMSLPEFTYGFSCTACSESKPPKERIVFDELEPIPVHAQDMKVAKLKLQRVNEDLDELINNIHQEKYLPWYSFFSAILLLIIVCYMCKRCFGIDICRLLYQCLCKMYMRTNRTTPTEADQPSTNSIGLQTFATNQNPIDDSQNAEQPTTPLRRSSRISAKNLPPGWGPEG